MHALRHVYNLDLDIHSLFSGSSEHHLEKKKHLHMAFRLFPVPEVSVFVTALPGSDNSVAHYVHATNERHGT